MGLIETKRKARRQLHEAMKVAALLLRPAGTDTAGAQEYAEPVSVHVRVHKKWTALGDAKGTNFHFSERTEEKPQIIFDLVELDTDQEVQRGSIICATGVNGTEFYRADHSLPVDGEHLTVECVEVPEDETASLPEPEEEA